MLLQINYHARYCYRACDKYFGIWFEGCYDSRGICMPVYPLTDPTCRNTIINKTCTDLENANVRQLTGQPGHIDSSSPSLLIDMVVVNSNIKGNGATAEISFPQSTKVFERKGTSNIIDLFRNLCHQLKITNPGNKRKSKGKAFSTITISL